MGRLHERDGFSIHVFAVPVLTIGGEGFRPCFSNVLRGVFFGFISSTCSISDCFDFTPCYPFNAGEIARHLLEGSDCADVGRGYCVFPLLFSGDDWQHRRTY